MKTSLMPGSCALKATTENATDNATRISNELLNCEKIDAKTSEATTNFIELYGK
jgi:hypothetical protein